MVGADSKPEGTVTAIDNIVSWMEEQPVKTISIILIVGIIIGILLSWAFVAIKKSLKNKDNDLSKF